VPFASQVEGHASSGTPPESISQSSPLGALAERNLEAVPRVGAGQRHNDPRADDEWISDWAIQGLLALDAKS
jgi:hypothetical protein